jgi:hypothetical protein
MTDFALFKHHLVQHFIVFTQHARREAVINQGLPEAIDVAELTRLVYEAIKKHNI